MRLAGVAGVEVVGVCRNRSGSAFLRLNGIECRHGDVAIESQAYDLLRDSDVVMQLAYRAPRSRSGRLSNRMTARNCVLASPKKSHTVAASTIMVYGPDLPFGVLDAYGLEKLFLERLILRNATQASHRATVLRIGHALGDLQPLSEQIGQALKRGLTELPLSGTRPSNTVFVASLADVAVRAVEDRLPNGTFDLVTSPQWTWAEVFNWYAAELGVSFTGVSNGSFRWIHPETVMARLRGVLAIAPDGVAERIYGLHLRSMARSRRPPSNPLKSSLLAFHWRGVGNHPLPDLLSPEQANDRYALKNLDQNYLSAISHWPVSSRIA